MTLNLRTALLNKVKLVSILFYFTFCFVLHWTDRLFVPRNSNCWLKQANKFEARVIFSLDFFPEILSWGETLASKSFTVQGGVFWRPGEFYASFYVFTAQPTLFWGNNNRNSPGDVLLSQIQCMILDFSRHVYNPQGKPLFDFQPIRKLIIPIWISSANRNAVKIVLKGENCARRARKTRSRNNSWSEQTKDINMFLSAFRSTARVAWKRKPADRQIFSFQETGRILFLFRYGFPGALKKILKSGFCVYIWHVNTRM